MVTILVKLGYENGLLVSAKDVKGLVTRYEYDASKKLKKTILPTGASYEIAYDAAGKVSQVKNENGFSKKFGYDYDKARKEYYMQAVEDSGLVTEEWFDKDGGLLRKDVNGKTRKRIYIEQEGRKLTIADADGNETVELRDQNGRLVKKTFPDGAFIEKVYDSSTGLLLSETDENAVQTIYEYTGKKLKKNS